MAKKDYPTSYGPDPQDMLGAVGGYFKKTALGKVFSGASADEAPKKPAPNLGGMSGRGSAKAAPSYGKVATIKKSGSGTGMSDADRSYGATTGSITKPDKAAQVANKARGDAYLANNSSTDYGLGSAVNDFANKKKR